MQQLYIIFVLQFSWKNTEFYISFVNYQCLAQISFLMLTFLHYDNQTSQIYTLQSFEERCFNNEHNSVKHPSQIIRFRRILSFLFLNKTSVRSTIVSFKNFMQISLSSISVTDAPQIFVNAIVENRFEINRLHFLKPSTFLLKPILFCFHSPFISKWLKETFI